MYYRILKRIEGGLDSKTKERYCKEFYRIQFRKFLFNKWQDAFLQKAGGPISPSFPLIYDTLEDAEKALSNKRYLDDLKPKEKWAAIKTFKGNKLISNEEVK